MGGKKCQSWVFLNVALFWRTTLTQPSNQASFYLEIRNFEWSICWSCEHPEDFSEFGHSVGANNGTGISLNPHSWRPSSERGSHNMFQCRKPISYNYLEILIRITGPDQGDIFSGKYSFFVNLDMFIIYCMNQVIILSISLEGLFY